MNKIVEIDTDEYIKGLENGWYNMTHTHDSKLDIMTLALNKSSTSIVKCFKFKITDSIIDDCIIDRVFYHIHDGQLKMLIKAVVKK